LTLRGIVEDIMLTEQLAACLDAEGLESTTGEKLDPKPLVNGCMAQLVRFGGGGASANPEGSVVVFTRLSAKQALQLQLLHSWLLFYHGTTEGVLGAVAAT
jgi:hypothetical protein